MLRAGLGRPRGNSNDGVLWDEDVIKHVSALRNNTRETTEGSTKTARLFADSSQEGEAHEGLEVERGFGLWEGFVEFGLEAVVSLAVAEEVPDEEGEHSGGGVGTGLDGEERVDLEIGCVQLGQGGVVFTELCRVYLMSIDRMWDMKGLLTKWEARSLLEPSLLLARARMSLSPSFSRALIDFVTGRYQTKSKRAGTSPRLDQIISFNIPEWRISVLSVPLEDNSSHLTRFDVSVRVTLLHHFLQPRPAFVRDDVMPRLKDLRFCLRDRRTIHP